MWRLGVRKPMGSSFRGRLVTITICCSTDLRTHVHFLARTHDSDRKKKSTKEKGGDSKGVITGISIITGISTCSNLTRIHQKTIFSSDSACSRPPYRRRIWTRLKTNPPPPPPRTLMSSSQQRVSVLPRPTSTADWGRRGGVLALWHAAEVEAEA